jgi:uncharacterized delta-60 repeat protein
MKRSFLLGFIVLSTIASVCAQANRLDPSFANNGIFLNRDSIYAPCMLVQPDQKIILAGNTNFDYSLLRLNPDGFIDSSFGVNGYVFDPKEIYPRRTYWIQAYSLAQQSDGRVLLAGTAGGEDAFGGLVPLVTWLSRYNNNGTKDSSFGTNGIIINTFDSLWPTSTPNILVGPGGEIFLTALGSNYSYYYPSWLGSNRVICYDSLGHIDSTYGVSGRIYLSKNQQGNLLSSTLQPDQKILLGGADTTGTIFSISRYTSSGIIDSSFGNNGIAQIVCDSDLGGFNYLYVQHDGSILATKYEQAIPASDHATFKLSRFTPSGSIDQNFGLSGCAQTIIPYGIPEIVLPIGSASFVAEYPDGKILVGGPARNDTLLSSSGPRISRPVFAFSRLLPDGTIDSSFGNFGVVISPPVSNPGIDALVLSGFVLLSDGKFLATGGGRQLDKFLAYAPNTGIDGVLTNVLDIYPNPVNTTLHINSSFSDFSISISDITGRTLFKSIDHEIDVSALPSGVYFLRIQNNHDCLIRKFVKD